MNHLLDTCVLSEFTRRQPDDHVVDWLDNMEEDNLFLSVISIGEIQRSILRLLAAQRKADLTTWLQDGLLERFAGRILDVDTATMLTWGTLTARLDGTGKPMPVMDALIAATALQHNMTLATHNVADFTSCGVQLVNPWKSGNESLDRTVQD